MRPFSLEFCGINSFSEPQKINFEELLRYGIFGIFGDTGSGKSTILDCIGFALYGDVARSRSGKIADIINYGKDKAYVNFEFGIDYGGKRRRYRVERELKRKNAAQNLKVYEYDEGKSAFVCVADAVRQGNELLEDVIGLEQKDFEKCIALPQGEFAQFVKATRSDRLKLVSRLFDLERYGEGLVQRTNNAFREVSGAADILKARLEPYAEISEEHNTALKKEIASLRGNADLLRKKLEESKREEKRVSMLYEKAKEAAVIAQKFEKLQSELEETEQLEEEINRLGKAELVARVKADFLKAVREAEEADKALLDSEKRLKRESETLESAAAWDFGKAEQELLTLAEQRIRAQEKQKSAELAGELKAKLNLSREEYKRLKEAFAGFDYEKEKGEIEERLALIGSAVPDAKIKASLFREEYAAFGRELEEIGIKYPETQADILPLAQKYKALSEGEKVDFIGWAKENEAREERQRKENGKLQALERKYGDYKANLIKLSTLEEEGLRLKEELSKAESAMLDGVPPVAELDRRSAALKEEVRAHAEAKELAAKKLAAAQSDYAVCTERAKSASMRKTEAEGKLKEAIAQGGFLGCEEAEALLNKFGDAGQAKERVQRFREEFSAVKANYEKTKDTPSVTEEELCSVQGALKGAESACEEQRTLLALKEDELRRKEAALAEKKELNAELTKKIAEKAIYDRLKKLFESNKFMEFVAEEYLVTVALNASTRLLTLTNGQYFLKYDKGFFVGDNLHGGALRGVNTLSGGEIFLVSLSLALALSAEICTRNLRSSEFFFLDEGFGTLDVKLVDTVMDSLEKLRSEHFSIGIISHVEELKHRISCKLTVRKATEKHGSQITTE